MNNPETGCPSLDDVIRRLDRVIEQVKQQTERSRELQIQIDRLYRVGLEAAPRTSFDDLQDWVDSGCTKPDLHGVDTNHKDKSLILRIDESTAEMK